MIWDCNTKQSGAIRLRPAPFVVNTFHNQKIKAARRLAPLIFAKQKDSAAKGAGLRLCFELFS